MKKLEEFTQKVETLREKLKSCQVCHRGATLLPESETSQHEYETLDGQVKEADKEVKTFEAGKQPLLQARAAAKKKLDSAKGILKQTQVCLTA